MPQVPLIAGKTAVPALPDRVVARPRLTEDLGALVAGHRLVSVLAPAGAGKTTALVQAARRLDRPVAWLTLDDTDAAPGRLLLYLERALVRGIPDMTAVAAAALAAGIGHAEAAALVAEAVPEGQAVLVVDEIERIADAAPAVAVLAAFVRYAGPRVGTVVVGRRGVALEAGSRIPFDEVAQLDEHRLAFTTEEAAAALALRGLETVDPAEVVQVTGGWVAGVLFEAWHPQGRRGGARPDADPLGGALGRQLVDGLDARERDFLETTSLLEEVTPAGARALGLDAPEELLVRLRARHLPVTWSADGTSMRCHPRFRDHLRVLLDRRDAAEVNELRRRHGCGLAEAGRPEEAVEQLMASGHDADALAPAVEALPAVIARQDVDVAQRWLKRFEGAGLLDNAGLLAARLSVAVTLEEFGRAVDAADRLRRLGDPTDGEARALAAWAYTHVGRIDDAREMLDGAPAGRLGEAVRHLFSLIDSSPVDESPAPSGGPLDALMLRVAYVRGRLTEVRDAPVSDWMPAITERIAAYRALGELDRTQEMLASAPGVLHNLRFDGTVRAELMMDLGHEEEAREALLRGRASIVRSGSFLFDVVSRLLAAKLELRMRRDAPAAIAILRGAESAGPTRRYGYLAEQTDVWMGYALLLEGRDAEALARLGAAVASMEMADRILELPTAGIYLAEAQWRAGDPAAADAAAETALLAARRQGSPHLLLQAIDDMPSVGARLLDGEAAIDGPWHELLRGRASGRLRSILPGARLRLADFGTPSLTLDGEQRRARIAKTYVLLAYLAHHDGSASRAELLDGLFDGRSDTSTRAYLRQAVHGLRQILPEGVELFGEDERWVLSDPRCVETESMVLEARLASAAGLAADRRAAALGAALAPYERGAYFAGTDCAWVVQRRAELAALVAEARIGMAVAAFEDSRFDLAESVLERVLAEEPHRERAWRLLIRVAAARGADDRVIALYRRCEQALAELGLEPSESTRTLVARVRH